VKAASMTATAHANYQKEANLLKALAHPARLLLVDELARGERCVSELARIARLDMPAVSRHLRLLKHVGVLEAERRGAQVFYRLLVPGELQEIKRARSTNPIHDPIATFPGGSI
jgi:DNA-binding transcriptional ArsR family regulator